MLTFLSPFFLAAASAAVIPLVLHFMARRRTTRVPFSTIRFLQLAQKQSSTKVRMENFLLWLVRTLLLLLLAFAFARPVARLSGNAGFGSLLGSSRRDVAIVWDASASMSYEVNGKTVFDASKETVLSIIHGLSKGDRVSIFLAADTVIPLVAEPSSDLEFAINTVKAQEYRYTTSSLSDATQSALESIKNTQNEHELFIVSDGQATAWDGFRNAASSGSSGMASAQPRTANAWDPQRVDRNLAPFVCLLGPRTPVNTAPVNVDVQPPLIMTDTAPDLLVTLGHTGPVGQTSVSLDVDGREVLRRSIDLAANGGFKMMFNLPPMASGVHAVRVRTSEDPLMADNDYLLLLKVRENLPILVAGSEDDCFFLMHALEPSDKAPVKAKRIDPGLLASETLDNYPCIFLVNALPLAGPAISNLQEYVRRGGVAAIFPGDRAKADDYNALSFIPAKVDHVEDSTQGASREALVLLDPLDPLFAGLKMPPGVSPGATVVRQLAFSGLNADAKPLVGASSEKPLLLSRHVGGGRSLLFTVSADRQWSDLPLSPFFLPLVHQTVRLACGIGQDKVQVQPASSFLLSEVISRVPEGATLLGPDKNSLPIRRVQTQGREGEYALIVDHVDKPGYYFLSGPDASPEPLMAVNLDRTESDLTPIDPAQVQGATGFKSVTLSTSQDELMRQVQEHRVGRPLSEVALWAVLLLSALELWMANRACRKRATLSDSLTIHASGRVLGKAIEPAAA